MKTFTNLLSESVELMENRGGTGVGAGLNSPLRMARPGAGLNPGQFMGMRMPYGSFGGGGTRGKLSNMGRRGIKLDVGAMARSLRAKGKSADQAQRMLPRGTKRTVFGGAALTGLGALAYDVLTNPVKYTKLFYKKVVDPVVDSFLERLLKNLGFSDSQVEWVKNNTGMIMAGVLATGATASQTPRLIRSVKRWTKNKSIMSDIKTALEMGDEELARAIMIDAIEDDGFELSQIKRKLTAGQFDQLVR